MPVTSLLGPPALPSNCGRLDEGLNCHGNARPGVKSGKRSQNILFGCCSCPRGKLIMELTFSFHNDRTERRGCNPGACARSSSETHGRCKPRERFGRVKAFCRRSHLSCAAWIGAPVPQLSLAAKICHSTACQKMYSTLVDLALEFLVCGTPRAEAGVASTQQRDRPCMASAV